MEEYMNIINKCEINTFEDLLHGIKYFNESTCMDELANTINTKWVELGKEYIPISESLDFFSYASEEMKNNTIEIMNESVMKSFDTTPSKPVYVMLTHSGTLLANVIQKYTKNKFSHSSISFDDTMDNVFSFGRMVDKKGKAIKATFVMESLHSGFFKMVEDSAIFGIYVTFVNEFEFAMMKKKVLEFWLNSKKFDYKYNLLGLFNFAMGRETHRKNTHFCSEFVDIVLRGSGKKYFDQHSSLVAPHHFAQNMDFHLVSEGQINEFDSKELKKNTKALYNRIKKDILKERENEEPLTESIGDKDISNIISLQYSDLFNM